MNKQYSITVTAIANGFVVVGADESSSGAFGRPPETKAFYVPTVKRLNEVLPDVMSSAMNLTIDEGGLSLTRLQGEFDFYSSDYDEDY